MCVCSLPVSSVLYDCCVTMFLRVYLFYIVFCFFFFFQAEDGIRDWRDWSSDVCSSDLLSSHGRANIGSDPSLAALMKNFSLERPRVRRLLR